MSKHLKIDSIDNYNKLTDFDLAVFDSFRKSINRFRERPLLYFTESDIHSFLQSDLIQSNIKLFIHEKRKISLVHLEYPTNFRYKKQMLLKGYPRYLPENSETNIDSKTGDRGNFDLTILNPGFIDMIFKCFHNEDIAIEHIINKDVTRACERLNNANYNTTINDGILAKKQFNREIKYAVEVKFIHRFNARNINMLKEIVKDNEKLRLAYLHSNHFIRPINLIFCSSVSKSRSDKQDPVIKRIKDYIIKGKTFEFNKVRPKFIPEGVVNIFIESYFSEKKKTTLKPIVSCKKPKQWVKDFCDILNIDLNELMYS